MEKTKILVVEDESITALDICKALDGLGYSVTGMASTAVEAVEACEKQRPDLVLMDIMLKGQGDGIQAGEAIRKLDIPLVYLTALVDETTFERAKVTECYGYIVKPFSNRELHIGVEMALYRHALELKLSERERRLEEITSSLGGGIYVLNDAGRLTYMNREAERLLGWSQDELLGRKIHEIFHGRKENGEPLSPEDCSVHKVFKTGERQYSDHDIFMRKDGSAFPVNFISTPIVRNAEVVASITIFQDAGRAKKIEDLNINSRKVEALGILASGVAHDFNNLLTAILGNISFAKTFLAPDEKAYEVLTSAESAGFQARELTYTLLTFARGGKPDRETVDMGKMLRSSANFACSGSPVMCRISVPSDIWTVEADEAQLSRVVHNIVVNAREAMDNSGTIRITAENASVSASEGLPLQPGDYIKIKISDNGPGIMKEELSRIFDPYFTTKKAGKEGTGLGLSISYSVIQNHGGCIAAESLPGQETIFTIYLPASLDRAKPKVRETEVHPAGKGRVLIMDDEEVIRVVVKNMLNHMGYEVDAAANGEEAIALYRREKERNKPFDAVILDLTIRGGMGGAETIGRLIQMDPEVTAIVSSGYSQDPVMADFRKYGFRAVLPKPYKMDELGEVIHAAMNARDGQVA